MRPERPKDGGTPVTAALQHAIDELSATGGGRLTLGAGKYLTGGVFLKNGVTFRDCDFTPARKPAGI